MLNSLGADFRTTAPPGLIAPITTRRFRRATTTSKWAIEWSADAMVNSFIAKKDLDSEMTVVRNEFERGENEPTRVMLTRMQSMLYDWHNYGNSTIGARSDIENVRIANLQAFYRQYYQPDNAVLIVAGNIRRGQDARLDRAGVRKDSEAETSAAGVLDGRADARRRAHFHRAAAGEVQFVMIGYRVPSSLSPQSLATGLAAEILGDTPNGRLHQALVTCGQGGAGIQLQHRSARAGLRSCSARSSRKESRSSPSDRR